MYKFNDFLLSEIGDKDNSNLLEQIFFEIKAAKSLSKICEVKGFGNFIKSTFSNYHYIINNIDIIQKSFIEKTEYIVGLLEGKLKRYIEGLSHIINKACDIISIRFANEQLNNSNS